MSQTPDVYNKGHTVQKINSIRSIFNIAAFQRKIKSRDFSIFIVQKPNDVKLEKQLKTRALIMKFNYRARQVICLSWPKN